MQGVRRRQGAHKLLVPSEPKRTHSHNLPAGEIVAFVSKVPNNLELADSDEVRARAQRLVAEHSDIARIDPLGPDDDGSEMFCVVLGHGKDVLGIAADAHASSEPVPGTATLEYLSLLANDPGRLGDRTVVAYFVDRSNAKLGDAAIHARNKRPNGRADKPVLHGFRSLHPYDMWEWRFEEDSTDLRVNAIQRHVHEMQARGFYYRMWVPGHDISVLDGLETFHRYDASRRRQSLVARGVEGLVHTLRAEDPRYPPLSQLPHPDAHKVAKRLLGTSGSVSMTSPKVLKDFDPTFGFTVGSVDWMLQPEQFPDASCLLLELPENVLRRPWRETTAFRAAMQFAVSTARISRIAMWTAERALELPVKAQKDPYIRAAVGWSLADAWGTTQDYVLPPEARDVVEKLAKMEWRARNGPATEQYIDHCIALWDGFDDLEQRCGDSRVLSAEEAALHEVFYPYFVTRNTLPLTPLLQSGRFNNEGVRLGNELEHLQEEQFRSAFSDLRPVPTAHAVRTYIGAIETAWQGIVHDRLMDPVPVPRNDFGLVAGR